MKFYTIKPDHLTEWGENCTEDTIIDGAEVMDLADGWETTVAELLPELIWESGESCISVDNGHTFVDPAEAIAAVGFDTIVNAMDDSLREYIHNQYMPDTDLEFLTRYLEISPTDLVIG